jgi:spore germination cell wall hydrolase CwlJ-like protein
MSLKQSMILFFTVLFSIMILKVTYDAANRAAIEEAPVVIKQVNTKHLHCLATAIYYEAGREPFLGQVAVARVVMNRVRHGFASDPCRVVYQKTVKTDSEDNTIVQCQFSWVCEGLTAPTTTNSRYQQSLSIARQVLAEDKWSELLPSNTLFFHNLSVHPRWVYNRVTQIGNHIFYSKGSPKIIQKD